MLTVVGTLRLQRRNLWDYLVQVCQAAALGQPAPGLLPQTSTLRVTPGELRDHGSAPTVEPD